MASRFAFELEGEGKGFGYIGDGSGELSQIYGKYSIP